MAGPGRPPVRDRAAQLLRVRDAEPARHAAASASTSSNGALDRRSRCRRPVRGLGGDRPRRDPCTILDEVMAWSLVGEDDWGSTARLQVEFGDRSGWARRSAPTAGSVAATSPGRHGREDRRRDDRRRARRRRPACTSPRDPSSRSANSGSATGSLPAPLTIPPSPWPRSVTAGDDRQPDPGRGCGGDPTVASAATARADAFVADRRPRAEALGTRSPTRSTTRTRSRRALRQRPRRARRSRVPRRPAARRPGPRPDPSASGRRCSRRSSAASSGHPRRSPDHPAVRRGSPVPRAARSRRAGSPSASSSGRSTGEPERTWQLLRRAAREAGDWITVETSRDPYGAGIVAEPVPLGGARAARLLAVALGAAPRRLDDRHDHPRSTGDRRRRPGRRARTADPRSAHRRRRAGRPEGALVGVSLARAARRGGRRPRAARRGRPSRATADGHRAWVIRDSLAKLDPADADELRTRSPASVAEPEPRPHRPPPRPRRGSASCPTRRPTPNRPCAEPGVARP